MEWLSTFLSPETIISVASLAVTTYFWFVRANRERPDLKVFQLQDFRAVKRRTPGEEATRRLCIQQVDSCGVLLANNSTRQNSIVMFECTLEHEGITYRGDWGYVEDDKPPWNIGPESSISLGLACFFDVPEDLELPDDFPFQISFVTVSGQKFTHTFRRIAPRWSDQTTPHQRAA